MPPSDGSVSGLTSPVTTSMTSASGRGNPGEAPAPGPATAPAPAPTAASAPEPTQTSPGGRAAGTSSSTSSGASHGGTGRTPRSAGSSDASRGEASSSIQRELQRLQHRKFYTKAVLPDAVHCLDYTFCAEYACIISNSQILHRSKGENVVTAPNTPEEAM